MKKLLVLMFVGILTISAGGCRQCRWFQGTPWRQEVEPVIVDPCTPMVSPTPSACSPCATAPATTTTPIIPGPGTYVPSNP